jgi:ribosomal protein S18 acetylase RimI-like enzyme
MKKEMSTKIRPCLITELDTLQRLAHATFDEAFRSMNTKETMNIYLQEAFNKEKLLAELTDRNCKFYFLYADCDLTGYLKLNDAPAQSDINDPESLEVERIYIRKEYQGKGLGEKLMDHAVQIGKEMKKRHIWLGVWEKNTDAIAFYTKRGFHVAGRHSFKMGNELQSDWIMKKTITEQS